MVESKKIVDLPLNGRFFTRLAVLTAGTLPTAPGARDERTGGFSANGVSPYQNNYLLDGIDNNSLSQDLTNEASFVYGPSPDAIAEFKVQTNSMSAEFGRSGGAVMNVTIKSGTNDFHGSVFEFLRNSKLDAKNIFDPPDSGLFPRSSRISSARRLADRWNFPVTTARIGRSSSPIIRGRGFARPRHFSPRWRLWHGGPAISAGSITILDPNTTVVSGSDVKRQPFPAIGSQQPVRSCRPEADLALMPAPNVPGSVSPSGVANNYLTNPVEPNNTDQGDVRMDHRISDKDSMFVRFSMSDQA